MVIDIFYTNEITFHKWKYIHCYQNYIMLLESYYFVNINVSYINKVTLLVILMKFHHINGNMLTE